MNNSFLLALSNKFLFLITYCLCPLSFFIPRGGVILLGICGIIGYLRQGFNIYPLLRKSFIVCFLILISWVGISSLWSVFWQGTLYLTFKLGVILILGLGWARLVQSLDLISFLKMKKYLLGGVITSIVLLNLEMFSNHMWEIWQQKSSAKAFVPLALTISVAIWPCLSLFQGKLKNLGCIVLTSLSLQALFLIDCDTAILAVLCGIIGYYSCLSMPYLAIKFTKFIAFLLCLLTPIIFLALLNPQNISIFNHSFPIRSYVHRLYIWEYVGQKISSNWILGYGGDSSRDESVGGETKQWPFLEKHGSTFINSDAIPLHPHNLPLQLWLELGAIGALLGGMLHFSSLNHIASITNFYKRAEFFAFFIASCLTFWVNLGCWQSWWLCTLGLIIPLISSKNTGSNDLS